MFLQEVTPKGTEECNVTVTEDEALRWHRRLGHLNRASLNKLLNFPSITLKGNVCGICDAGKITAKPFPRESRTRAKEPLELIHSDVMCIGTTRARNGEQYIVTFIDDCTRFGITYLTRAKSDVLESFQDYK